MIAGVSILALFVCILWQRWVIIKVTEQKFAQSIPNQSSTPENQLFDFRVINELGCEIWFEVWYLYNAPFNIEDISIDAVILQDDQEPDNGTFGGGGGIMSIVGSKAISTGEISFKPGSSKFKSTHIKLCMTHFQKGVFYCMTFPFEKTWYCEN